MTRMSKTLFFLMLFSGAITLGQTTDSSVKATRGLLDRLLPNYPHKGAFEFSRIPQEKGRDVFEIESCEGKWMGCLDGWGGPLGQSWIDRHEKLQQTILTRQRELGMTPVLQGFTGHIHPEPNPDYQSNEPWLPHNNRWPFLVAVW